MRKRNHRASYHKRRENSRTAHSFLHPHDTQLTGIMSTIKPHFLLFCEGDAGSGHGFDSDVNCRWRFILENVETGHKVEACDYEEVLHPDRIALISVIRGLEALDQPSKVTMITNNRYVARGLQYGLSEWRESDFCWEHFGSIQPIRNADLWRRVDIALRYHEVTCRWMSYDPQHERYEGDRREVPVDTQQPIRAYSNPTKQPSAPAIPSIAPSNPSPALPLCPAIESPPAQLDNYLKKSVRSSWETILKIDSWMANILRSLCLIDPKPEHYHSRRTAEALRD